MMPRPNIQIDDEVREMTDEEYAQHVATVQNNIYPQETTEEEYSALVESGWTEESTGEQAAPQPVEEEVSPDAPVADSSSPPSDS